jgi:hypothetical protein
MDRKRRILSRLLSLPFLAPFVCGCIDTDFSEKSADVCITLGSTAMCTKADLPDEDRISDISLMIFDSYGMLEKYTYLRGGQQSWNVNLLKGVTYSIYACINFGYEVKVTREEELSGIGFYLTYPDEYREGIPMIASLKGFTVSQDCSITLEAERLMARISLRMDRSRLSDGVKMDVIGVRIGNCPKKIMPFTSNRIESGDDCFKVGFRHDEFQCDPLNRQITDKESEELTLYMLENMQGRFSAEGAASHQEKVFEEGDPREHICSYVEIELDYVYKDMASIGKPLIYRFYLGDDLNSLDIERNCHYRITVTPEDDGLKGDGWRVDKSGIKYTGTPELTQYPARYIRGDIGDVIHIGCSLYPPDTPFDVGMSYMEDDKAAGIYDYVIDDDGHGATLTLTGSGTGLIYMEAGEPINDAALFIIEVNL